MICASADTLSRTTPEFEVAPELSLVAEEAQSTIDAMQARGAKQNDCRSLADSLCKEVKDAANRSQKTLNMLSRGSKCKTRGVKQVNAATQRFTYTTRQLRWAKTSLQQTKTTTISVKAQTYSTLNEGQCGWIFGERYSIVKTRVNKWRTRVQMLTGEVKEAKAALELAVKTHKREAQECRCSTKKARDTQWATATKANNARAGDIKKCKMMQCILAGTPIHKKKCHGTVPKLKNKVLAWDVQDAKC